MAVRRRLDMDSVSEDHDTAAVSTRIIATSNVATEELFRSQITLYHIRVQRGADPNHAVACVHSDRTVTRAEDEMNRHVGESQSLLRFLSRACMHASAASHH